MPIQLKIYRSRKKSILKALIIRQMSKIKISCPHKRERTHQQNAKTNYGTYTSKLNQQSHPNRDYAITQHTSKSNQKLEQTFKEINQFIDQDQQKGSEQVFSGLNQLVKKYEGPDIFANSNRRKYMPTHYRDHQSDNTNHVINNNTFLRVFDRNNPIDDKVKPILDQNVAGIRPKEAFLTYKEDNKGIIRRNKSQHFKIMQPNQLSQIKSERNFENSRYTNLYEGIHEMPQQEPEPALRSSIHSLGSFVQQNFENQSILRNSFNPLQASGQTQVNIVHEDRVNNDAMQKSGKVANSFNEVASRKNVFNRMIQNELRSRMLANEFINNEHSSNRANTYQQSGGNESIPNQNQFAQSSMKTQQHIPQEIINQNQFFKLEQVYRTNETTHKERPQAFIKDSPFMQQNGYHDSNHYPLLGKSSSMINLPSSKQINLTQNLLGVPQSTSFGLNGNTSIPQKANFKDLLDMSRTLDKGIKMR
ncbi:UNKNOWN [Stylonychia lemnae]|uniref:Uncharacterized protein n=1 Tax=Stylonychia lemnae TaxID=5949 RepID=A0A078ALM2_STYLE|nr:UNKNOWN [Stylonychia lemnae]|eukprot:CDW83255.1 UNKNOWN [Stylonychia lemnae]